MRTLLVIDVMNLCYRAWHALPQLSWQGRPTEVLFGFFRQVEALNQLFLSDCFAFCFEHPKLLRREIFPDYKHKRNHVDRDPQEVRALDALRSQIVELRQELLPRAGFRNVFCQEGYEADDLMAAIARERAYCKESVVLVTSDSDLFQCLAPNIAIYSPHDKKLKSDKWFREKYSISPIQWAIVKAMTGCKTDNVPGIPGVGEITAIKYLRRLLPDDSKAMGNISQSKEIVRRNRQLVELPFRGIEPPQLENESWNPAKWRQACKSIGMR